MSSFPAFDDYPFDITSLSTGEGEGYLIKFPDLPGCIADGNTEEDAIAQAQSAFHAWMTSMIEDDQPIPLPGSA